MPKYPFESEITAAALKYGLDPDHVAAHCFVESSFDPEARRYEAKFQRKYIDRLPKYEKLDPGIRFYLAMSMGLLQVMGATANEDGLPLEFLRDLFKPAVGLEYGCKQLSQLCRRYHYLPNLEPLFSAGPSALTDVISAYNAGTARRGNKGGYPNQGYVNKVFKKYKEFKRLKA
jgi:hypothetical protein